MDDIQERSARNTSMARQWCWCWAESGPSNKRSTTSQQAKWEPTLMLLQALGHRKRTWIFRACTMDSLDGDSKPGTGGFKHPKSQASSLNTGFVVGTYSRSFMNFMSLSDNACLSLRQNDKGQRQSQLEHDNYPCSSCLFLVQQ